MNHNPSCRCLSFLQLSSRMHCQRAPRCLWTPRSLGESPWTVLPSSWTLMRGAGAGILFGGGEKLSMEWGATSIGIYFFPCMYVHIYICIYIHIYICFYMSYHVKSGHVMLSYVIYVYIDMQIYSHLSGHLLADHLRNPGHQRDGWFQSGVP